MCIRLNRIGAEALRVHLLKAYGVGTISTGEADLRIAFSSLEVGQIQDFFDLVLRGWQDLVRGMATPA